MAVLQDHHPVASHHFARRAWVALALVPVGLVLAMILAFAGGEHGADTNRMAGAGLSVLALAPAAAAVSFAFLADHAGEHSARVVLVVSMIVAVVCLLALPTLVVSGEAALIAAGACVIGIALFGLMRSRLTNQ